MKNNYNDNYELFNKGLGESVKLNILIGYQKKVVVV